MKLPPTTALAACLLLAANPATADHGETSLGAGRRPPHELDAGAIRQDYHWESSRLEAESFWLSEQMLTELAGLSTGARRVISGFPVGPGERATVEFERFEVYAPGARVWISGEEGEREIERSDRRHLLGRSLTDPRVRLGLSVDPDGTRLSGLVAHASGIHDLRELEGSNASDRPVYEIGRDPARRLGVEISTACETPDNPVFFDPLAATAGGGSQPHTAGDLHLAVLAFDTDGELIQNMFGGSASAANAGLGDFVTASNAIYERDFSLRLQQGDTVLRTDAAMDPYAATSTSGQLAEVEEWWATNKGAVFRTFVALFSGKSPSNFSGSGRAWVGAYCDNGSDPAGGGSYSVNQVLKALALDSSINVGLVDHEIGHNAGSRHTHCYPTPIDQCYNAQSGCYVGPVSCPNWSATIPGISANKGTIMSYCHFSQPSGAGCGSNELFFHPTVIANITGWIDSAHAGACIGHVATCSIGTDDLPVSGSTGGTVTHEACDSITYSNWTAQSTANVTARSPLVVFGNNVSIDGAFTAENAVP